MRLKRHIGLCRWGAPPGPITARLTEAYKALAGFDFVAQYLNRLDGAS